MSRGKNIFQMGQVNEKKVAAKYERQGYEVLRIGDTGFPDLIILKDKKIEFFIEVKGQKHKVHREQKNYHKKLKDKGYEVKIEKVDHQCFNGNVNG
ncbi:MAG TPA: hypothetical protein DCX95_07400 [Elusimicrobia bacterium]|nr:hypothetical protein [Elusimicrobiota bacterium]